VTSQLSFYLAYLNKSTRFGKEFSLYGADYDYNFHNKTVALKILQELNREGLIRDNFLQLNIQFHSNTYRQEADVVAFSMDALGAQIGGVLSLWLSVTILLIFEICEFLIILLSAGWCVKRNQQTTLKEETNQSRL